VRGGWDERNSKRKPDVRGRRALSGEKISRLSKFDCVLEFQGRALPGSHDRGLGHLCQYCKIS
jgi:hypothetical protein